MPLLQNIEVASSRNVNKGLPEVFITLLLGLGVAALDFLARAMTDTEVIEQVPPWLAPLLAMALKDGAQYVRRVVRDRAKVDGQVDGRELPR